MTRNAPSFIGGSWIDGAPADDINPFLPAEVVAVAQHVDTRQVDQAIDIAADAARAWAERTGPSRGQLLHDVADILRASATEIATDLVREEGKTIGEALAECTRAAAIFDYFAAQTVEPDGATFPSPSANTHLFTRREPLGVVVIITPWNFPLAIPAWKIAPALAFGNAVVWKSAELVPLTSVRLIEALHAAGLPDGVVNLILGRGSDLGDRLLNRRVAAISFTGSNVVGRALQVSASRMGIKVQVEMGGQSPAVVLEDADLELACDQIARGAFLSAGQKCTSTRRIIVDRRIRDQFVEGLGAVVSSWKHGDPLDPETMIGPLASSKAKDDVMKELQAATGAGADILFGGRAPSFPGGGFFLEPTLLTNVPAHVPLSSEEVFGPVATLIAVDGYTEAIARANDSRFGLSAAIFTSDVRKAMSFVRDVRAGVVKVNQETAGLEYHVPFGGVGESSAGGREQGKAAQQFYSEEKTVYLHA